MLALPFYALIVYRSLSAKHWVFRLPAHEASRALRPLNVYAISMLCTARSRLIACNGLASSDLSDVDRPPLTFPLPKRGGEIFTTANASSVAYSLDLGLPRSADSRTASRASDPHKSEVGDACSRREHDPERVLDPLEPDDADCLERDLELLGWFRWRGSDPIATLASISKAQRDSSECLEESLVLQREASSAGICAEPLFVYTWACECDGRYESDRRCGS
ncbi:uncharacterized protein BJ171DRAFT_489156 [Polychytrium aggregatum]|uniref:uncharacterized protein n=1 Tax=Polychytrium aggregatum TaxID=110093 RepID=UPI0022FF3C3E|nr:uncharacterized protein BJ171DRAFT_539138 [Polychytrium aggregatum]XP_052970589.1 uncharacterized protein BJ171DRAFT_489156 [Polychytrium aggregatum]KAI9190850.1 hypothetical protein BJ171DRAFT_539138 [Polychytrium aggregatum]KAI9208509.1 hypothetical protein BJ171DRAFT_489156 [Polychytrium aggregatum]